MTKNSYADILLFSGETAVEEALNTQVNLSSVVLFAIAALALHFLSRCWANRKQFEGYAPTEPNEQNSYYQSAHSV